MVHTQEHIGKSLGSELQDSHVFTFFPKSQENFFHLSSSFVINKEEKTNPLLHRAMASASPRLGIARERRRCYKLFSEYLKDTQGSWWQPGMFRKPERQIPLSCSMKKKFPRGSKEPITQKLVILGLFLLILLQRSLRKLLDMVDF